MKRLALLLGFIFYATAAFAQLSMTGFGPASDKSFIPPTGMKTPALADLQVAPSTSTTNYGSIAGGQWSSAAIGRDQPMPFAGSIRDLTVRAPITLTQGTYTVAVAINGIIQTGGPTCQITTSTTTCSDTSSAHEIPFLAGDRVAFSITPSGTPTAQAEVQIGAVIRSYSTDSYIAVPFQSQQSNSATNYTTLGMTISTSVQWITTESIASGIAPDAFTINSFYVEQGAVSGGTSYVYKLYKNGVAQAATTCTIGAAAQRCNVTGLSIAAANGDLFSVEEVPTGTPTTLPSMRATVGITPTTANRAMQIGSGGAVSGAATRYIPYLGPFSASATETTQYVIAPCNWTAKLLTVSMLPALSGVQTRDHTFRIGGVNQTLTCQMNSGATTACTDGTHNNSVATNNLLTWASNASGTAPATTQYKFSSVMDTCN